MKAINLPAVTLCIASASLGIGRAQPFQNLDYEAANTQAVVRDPATGDLIGSTADLLPGWQLSRDGTAVTSIGFNRASIPFLQSEGGPLIFDAQYVDPIFGAHSPLEGPFTFCVYTRSIGSSLAPSYSIIQRGDIPIDSRLLSYTYRELPFEVSVNGMTLTATIQNVAGSPQTVALDIAAYAGQNVELEFRGIPALGGFVASGSHDLDAIAFIVPEPSSYVIFALGIALCALFGLRFRTTTQR